MDNVHNCDSCNNAGFTLQVAAEVARTEGDMTRRTGVLELQSQIIKPPD
jgi:hypothetical protein